MAGHVLKRRRLSNPRRRRRNMSAKQIRYFGTARQRAALKNRRRSNARGRGRRRRNQGGGIVSSAEHAAQRAITAVERAAEDAIGDVTRVVNRRRRNVGEILTVLPAANRGRKRRKNRVARTANRRRRNYRRTNARRRNRTYNRARNRTRNRTHRRRNYRRHNPRSVRVVYRTRRRNSRRRNYGRRRNQGHMLGGDAGKVIAVLGGAAVTGIVTGFLPANLTSGFAGYLTTGVTAIVLGQVAGKAFRNKPIGTFVTVGGLLIVALNLVQQFFPTLQLPFTTSAGTSGMGLITSSNFYVPQVNQPGSMASFVTPAGITGAIPVPVASTGMSGLGQGAQPILGLRTMRRVGRMR